MAKWLQRITGVLLSAIMLFVSYIALPAKAIADDAEEAAQTEAIEAYADANDFSQDNSLAYSPLVGELREDRDESVKVFRRADGAQEAVVYSDPIHYLKDELWETIDNTLELVTLEDGTQAYRNKANDFIVSFSPYFNADNLITVESKGHILSWRFTEEVPFAQKETAQTPEESEPAEEPAAPDEDVAAEPVDDSAESSVEAEDVEAADTEATEPIDSEDVDMLAEGDPEEVTSEEPAAEEPEATETEEPIEEESEVVETEKPEEATSEEPEAEDESAYETLKITDAKAEIEEREHKEPETDEERDMLLRYPEELTSELTYKDPETGLNVHYVLSGKRLSEQIILDHAPETAIAYATLLTTNGLKAEEKDGRIVFVDESGEAIFEIMPPAMYDANGEESAEIEVRLTETEDGYAYTLIPDTKWLQDESRAYPVTVDPDVKITKNAGEAELSDTYVDSSYPNTNYGSFESIWVSNASGQRQVYSLVKANALPALKSGDIILEAGIHYAKYDLDTSAPVVVSGYRVTEDWEDTTATYNDLPAYDSDPVTFAATMYSNRYSEFDITSTVKSWYENPSSNYGILLKGNNYTKFISANASTTLPPYLSVIYRNSTGLESNWTYYSQSAGRAGTGSVNLASGNLTWTLSDGGITNGVLPISLSHVYNVNDIGSNLGYGRGWRLNYAQMLKRFPVANGDETTLYYEYTDGDGTRHYYKEDGDEFVNELDKDSKLTFSENDTIATIEDKGDNKLVFEIFTSGSGDDLEQNGRLIRIEDANGNKTVITYKNPTGWSLRISKITEQLAGQSAGQELTLEYNVWNLLKKITAPNGLNITFTYSSVNDLIGVTYTDGNSASFEYASHCLTKAANIDGYNLRYTYNEKKAVTGVREYAGSTAGQGLAFTHGRSKMVVTDDRNRKTIYTLDSLGQPLSVTDPEGRAMFAAYNSGEQTVTQLSSVSKLQNTVINLLTNHGFEGSSSALTGWTASDTNKITVDSSNRREGFRCAKFLNSAAELTLSQTLTVETGKIYTLSAYFKGEGSAQVKAATGTDVLVGDPVSANDEDWTRATVTFTATAGTAVVQIIVPANNGLIRADSVQLEESATPNRYNMLENSNFEKGIARWEERNYSAYNGIGSLADTAYAAYTGNHPAALGSNVYCFNHIAHAGELKNEYVSQAIPVNGTAGDTYSFGGWLMSTCPPRSEQWLDGSYVPVGEKSLTVEFLAANGYVTASSTVAFAADTTEWQYACGVAVATHSYSAVRIKVNAMRCIGTTLVDGLQLYRELFSQAYTYDSKGNLTGYKSLIGQQDSFTYDSNNNVTKSTDPRGNSTTYTYDSKHNLLTATSPQGVVTTNTYNTKGQVTVTKVGNSSTYIRSSSAYDAVSGLTSSITDARGNSILYGYDSTTRQNTSITDPKGNVSYYNVGSAAEMYRLTSLSGLGLNPVSFIYHPNGQPAKITRDSQEYNYNYDSWGRMTSMQVGSSSISTNTFDDAGRLSTVQYGNGFTVKYNYDALDRVSNVQIKASNAGAYILAYENVFNAEGNLYEERNHLIKRAVFYDYDHAGRCMASVEKAFTGTGASIIYGPVVSTYYYQYDQNNNVSKIQQSVDGSTWNMVYTYDSDNRGLTTTLSNNVVLSNSYDAVSRITNKAIGLPTVYNTVITYLSGTNGSSTPLIGTYQNGSDQAYSYSYDANDNITSITQGTQIHSYEYDAANQLTRANIYNSSSDNYSIAYDYDGNGNLTAKTYYRYSTGTLGVQTSSIAYSYSTGDWKDQLVSYNDQAITYDASGNPLIYLGNTLSWNGLQLVGVNEDISYEYNKDGLRQSKTIGNITTDFYYNGTVLMGTNDGTNKLLFSYDEQSNVVAVNYNGTYYYYLRDGQGNIVKLINGSGSTVVEYAYDPWGVCTTTGDMAATLGKLNPFRFHGYVYDEETNWYYLQSRYYNPEVGRYISADTVASTGQGILGYNMYAYCLNNPITNYDPTGSFSFSNIFSGAGLIAVGVIAICTAVSVISCGTAAPLMAAVAAVTLTAGTMTVANGVAEVQQGITATDENPQGQNFMRDGLCGGNTEAYEFQKNFWKTTAEVGTTILTCYKAVHGPCCFTAGTLVLTNNGQKSIEEIQEGDFVYATNPETGESGYKRVVQTFERETNEIVRLQIDGETITTTPGHPFYVPQKGWTKAIELRAGDILVTSNGEYVILEKTEHEILESPVKVFNFEVEEFHTYYVGSALLVLVHNKCGDIGPYKTLKADNMGSGLEAHHIIEKRFINGNPSLGPASQMQSVMLDKATHQGFTNAWRQQLAYGKTYGIQDIMNAARIVYKDNPDLLSIALQELLK